MPASVSGRFRVLLRRILPTDVNAGQAREYFSVSQGG